MAQTTPPFQPVSVAIYGRGTNIPAQPEQPQADLISAVLPLLRKIYRHGHRYKKTGIFVTELVPEGCVQLSLFDQPAVASPRKALEVAVDQLNRRYGTNTVLT